MFVMAEVVALNGAMDQLVRLEGVLASIEEVEIPQQYLTAVNNAQAFLSDKKAWVRQAQDKVFDLGPSMVARANCIRSEASFAATLIESYGLSA